MVVLSAPVTIIGHGIVLSRISRPVQTNKGTTVGCVVVHLGLRKILSQRLVSGRMGCRYLKAHPKGVLHRV